jgi:DNA-directed RNA polymerase subunit M/transcription elongation factor TFIIS
MSIYYREEHVHILQRRTCPYTTEKNMTIYYREEHDHILQRRTCPYTTEKNMTIDYREEHVHIFSVVYGHVLLCSLWSCSSL